MSSSERTNRRPPLSKLKQQQLPAWQPTLKPWNIICCFTFVGIIFIIIGSVILVSSKNVFEKEINYDCNDFPTCTITFSLENPINSPVYFYYQINGMYQNHRRYIKSRSDNQLRGDPIFTTKDLIDCSPYITADGSNAMTQAYFPCGLIAKSRFNDSFTLNIINKSNNTLSLVNWTKSGIAWPSDIAKKFNQPPVDQTGLDVVKNRALFIDEDFIVWMRISAFPDFRKIYRYIENGLSKGDYIVNITDNYSVSKFGAKKAFVISTTSSIGGKMDFFGTSYIIVGVICFVVGMFFLFKHATRSSLHKNGNYEAMS